MVEVHLEASPRADDWLLLGGDEAGQRRAPEAAAVPETDFGFVQSPERRGGAACGAGDAGEEESRSGGGRG